ncbi:MAG: hypothetical protein IJN67_10390 [Oscillospiraceae bacterium]|nr:hypothetical protein [Oscillospiraceae bacterium]
MKYLHTGANPDRFLIIAAVVFGLVWLFNSWKLGRFRKGDKNSKRRISLLIGLGLLAFGVGFLIYAGNHPESGFPWSNRITFLLYGMYLWLLLKFLVDIPLVRSIRKPSFGGGMGAAVSFLAMSAIFLLMEVTSDAEADFYTVLRGFIFLGGFDLGIESLLAWWKQKKR